MPDSKVNKRRKKYRMKSADLRAHSQRYDVLLQDYKRALYQTSLFHARNSEAEVEELCNLEKLISKHIQTINDLVNWKKSCSLFKWELREAQKNLDEYKKQVDIIFHRNLKELRAVHPKLNSKGRPSTKPRIAIILFEALESFAGSRKHIDELGRYISPRGGLKEKLGETRFNKMNLPTPNFSKKIRWEKDIKRSLKNTITKYEKAGQLTSFDLHVCTKLLVRFQEQREMNRLMELGLLSDYDN